MRFLSIDAGAMLGLIPLEILENLEAETGKPISELFDGFAGSSTGAIITTALNTRNHWLTHKPKFTSAEVTALYKANADNIFSFQAVGNAIWNLFGAASNSDFENAAKKLTDSYQENFGTWHLSQLIKPQLITTVKQSPSEKELRVFSSEEAKKSPASDLPLWEAVWASSALDMFFGKASISHNDSAVENGFSDAALHGVVDPTYLLCQFIEKNHPGKKAIVYSFGTGFGTSYKTLPYMNGKHKNIEVIRLEPDFSDRQGNVIADIANYFHPRGDVNFLAIQTSAYHQDYFKKKAQEIMRSKSYKKMLVDLKK